MLGLTEEQYIEALQAWKEAKEAERMAVDTRRKIEDYLTANMGIQEGDEGIKNVAIGDYKVKITSRLSRKVNAEKLQELAIEAGLQNHLDILFRWKPEINMTEWKRAHREITDPLMGAITTTPGRPSFDVSLITE
jgi:hypothetical protein